MSLPDGEEGAALMLFEVVREDGDGDTYSIAASSEEEAIRVADEDFCAGEDYDGTPGPLVAARVPDDKRLYIQFEDEPDTLPPNAEVERERLHGLTEERIIGATATVAEWLSTCRDGECLCTREGCEMYDDVWPLFRHPPTRSEVSR